MRLALPSLLLVIAFVEPVVAAPKKPVFVPQPPRPPVFVAAPAVEQVSPATAARILLANDFAALYVPEDLVRLAATREFEKALRGSFDTVPANIDLEKRYPGSRDAGLRAGVGAVNRFFDENLASVRKAVADATAQRLEDADIAALNKFYQSPAGRSTMRAIVNNLDTTALAARAKANPGTYRVTTEDTRGMIDPGFVTELSAAERAQVMTFVMSPSGRRFTAAQGGIQDAMLATQNDAMAKFAPVIQSSVSEAIVLHIKSTKAVKP